MGPAVWVNRPGLRGRRPRSIRVRLMIRLRWRSFIALIPPHSTLSVCGTPALGAIEKEDRHFLHRQSGSTIHGTVALDRWGHPSQSLRQGIPPG